METRVAFWRCARVARSPSTSTAPSQYSSVVLEAGRFQGLIWLDRRERALREIEEPDSTWRMVVAVVAESEAITPLAASLVAAAVAVGIAPRASMATATACTRPVVTEATV